MNGRFRLVGLNDSLLLTELAALAARCNGLTAELIAHLGEVAERRLHLELGFASLHAYCVQELKMSEGAAGRRVAAARVCRRFPAAFELVARGELHLSALCALESRLTEENAAALLAESAGKTRRQVEELLAARFPRPDVRERVVRLPIKAVGLAEAQRGASTESSPRESGANSTSLPAASPVPAGAGEGASRGFSFLSSDKPRRQEIEPRGSERFTADRELRDLIERAKAVASHRLGSSDLAGVIKLALSDFVKCEEQRRFAVGAKARARITPPGGVGQSGARGPARDAGSAARRRVIPAAVRREVYVRDGARCTFVAADGRRCDARGDWSSITSSRGRAGAAIRRRTYG